MALRTVLFYRVSAGIDETGHPIRVNVGPIFSAVNSLDFEDGGRYLDGTDENITCCWVKRELSPSYIALGTIRRANLPQMERRGLLRPLPLPDGSGIVEQTHYVFFDTGIVGCLFNFYGPRVGRLRYYMREKAPAETPDRINFDLLLRNDAVEQLDRLKAVRVVELSVSRAFIDSVAQADQSLGSAFGSAFAAGDAQQIEIILKPRPYARDFLGERILSSIKRIARREHLREEVHRFKVKGLDSQSDRLEAIDVLRDRFAVEVEVEVAEGRIKAAVPESAYAGIERAYEAVGSQLLRAPGVR